MEQKSVSKNYSSTYLYNKSNQYEKNIFDFVMHGEEINKQDPTFEDIRYDIKKRQISNSLVKVLDSKNVILLSRSMPMPRAFKVFCCKDPKMNDGKYKVFIDVSDIIKKVEGGYKCNNIDILIAYLVDAMNTMIYYMDPKRLIMRNEIINEGAYCFATLFTHVIDYLYKISTTPAVRAKCLYLSSMYYMVNILKKEPTDSIKTSCRNIAGIQPREADVIDLKLDKTSFINIKYFIETLSDSLRIGKLTIDTFLEKWLYLFGTGTQFALEMYPSFSAMITNAYVGCYLNNQKTIEKILGRHIIPFTLCILKVGQESV